MGQVTIDRNELKSAIRELLVEEPQLFASVLRDLRADVKAGKDLPADQQRRDRLQKMIEEDFDRYDEVFKALA